MLGIQDFSILLAYVACILSTLLCIVYGFMNWNKGADGSSLGVSKSETTLGVSKYEAAAAVSKYETTTPS